MKGILHPSAIQIWTCASMHHSLMWVYSEGVLHLIAKTSLTFLLLTKNQAFILSHCHCSKVETPSTTAAQYCSSVVEESSGVLLRISMHGLSVLQNTHRANTLHSKARFPSYLYSVSHVEKAVLERPESKELTVQSIWTWQPQAAVMCAHGPQWPHTRGFVLFSAY